MPRDRWADYIMVRVLRVDHERLQAYRDRLEAWARKNPGRAPPYLLKGGFGLTFVIRELLRRQDEHNVRSKAYRQRGLKKFR